MLIPKISNFKTPRDFKPNSLCNVIFKIITKCIANRLKSFLPNIIHINQSAFIPRRSIIYNTLIAFETFYYLKQPRMSKNGFFVLKLDIRHMIEWNGSFEEG